MKALIYIVLAAAEDEETQKRGLIGMLYFTDALPLIQKLYEHSGPRLFDWLPIKLVGVHVCHDDPRFRILHAVWLLMMGKERRVRVRIHEGMFPPLCLLEESAMNFVDYIFLLN